VVDQKTQLTVVSLYLPSPLKISACYPSTSLRMWPNTSSSCQGRIRPSQFADLQIQCGFPRRRGQRHPHHLYYCVPVAWLRQQPLHEGQAGFCKLDFKTESDQQGLSNGVIPQGYWRKGPLFERLSVHPLSTQYLMPTLIRFFIGESSLSPSS
jgi:hypothetical protein